MVIRWGKTDDMGAILEMVDACVAELQSKGIFQWNETYPSADIIRADIEARHLFVLEDSGSCRGIVVLNEVQADEWGSVYWSEGSTRPLIVHRLIIHPVYQGSGAGRFIMDFAMDRARGDGYDSIRFDVYSGNPRLLATYERMGCVRRGEVRFAFRELPFYCYEMAL